MKEFLYKQINRNQGLHDLGACIGLFASSRTSQPLIMSGMFV